MSEPRDLPLAQWCEQLHAISRAEVVLRRAALLSGKEAMAKQRQCADMVLVALEKLVDDLVADAELEDVQTLVRARERLHAATTKRVVGSSLSEAVVAVAAVRRRIRRRVDERATALGTAVPPLGAADLGVERPRRGVPDDVGRRLIAQYGSLEALDEAATQPQANA